MRKTITPILKAFMLSLFFLTTLTTNLLAQDVLATEDFDGGGIGYTTTSEFNNGTGNNHFNDTDGSDISNVSGPYSFEGGGNIFWAAENVDDPAGNGSPEQRLATNNFSIAGYEGIQVCIDMAAGNEQLGNLGTYDQADYVQVQYNTDIQPLYIDAINFAWLPNASDPGDLFNQPFHHDPTRNGDGSDGVQLTTTAQNFCFTIPNSNTIDVNAAIMSIRVLVRMDANSEEIAFDNIVVTGILRTCDLIVDCSNIVDVTLQCREDLPPVDFNLPIITESCGNVTLSALTIIPGSEGCASSTLTIPRTYFIQDGDGNMAQCVQTFTIENLTPPLITCPADITVECDQSTDPADTGSATGMGNCNNSTVSITFSDASTQTLTGCTASNYTITRTWFATDNCGNVSTCDQLITVEDNTPPTITCPADVTIECTASTSVMSNGTAIATDACGTGTITSTDLITPGSCLGNFTIARTFVATDDCGNSSMCTQLITVEDTEGPIFDFVPSATTVECTDPYDVATLGNATAFDACEDALSTGFITTTFANNNRFAGNMFDVTNTSASPVTISSFESNVDDLAGQPCSFEIFSRIGTYVGFENSSAGWSSLGTTSSITAGTGNPTLVNIGGLTILPGQTVGIYFILTSYVGSNSQGLAYTNGNNSYMNATLQIDAGIAKTDAGFTGTTIADRTWNGTINYSVAPPPIVITATDAITGTCPQVVTRTFTATDQCGNASTVSQVITIEDTTPPIITCPADITINCGENSQPGMVGTGGGGTVNGSFSIPTSIPDNNPTGVNLPINISGIPAGATIADIRLSNVAIAHTWVGDLSIVMTSPGGQTLTILDRPGTTTGGLGDSSDGILSFPIGFTDAAPDLAENMGSTITGAQVICRDDGICSYFPNDGIAPAFAGLAAAINSSGLDPNGSWNFNISDNAAGDVGNISNVTLEIDWILGTPMGSGTGGPTVLDACGSPVTVTFADLILPGICANNSTIIRTFTATDNCGNASTCSQTITIQDIEAPLFDQAPGDLDVITDNSLIGALGIGTCVSTLDIPTLQLLLDNALAGGAPIPGITLPTATDNCTLAPTLTGSISYDVSNVCSGVIEMTITADDGCGNTSDYIIVITIDDVLPPVLDVSVPDLTLECTMPTDVAATGQPTFTDECVGSAITITNSDVVVQDPNCPNARTITRTFVATDVCGNTTPFVQIITVVDTEAPVYTVFPRDTTVECSTLAGMSNMQLEASVVANAQGLPTVEDNCTMGLAAPFTDNFMLSTACPTVGIFERTFAAIDDGCGNILPARTLTITIIDTLPPVFTAVPMGGDVDCAVGVPPFGLVSAVDCDPNVVITEVDDVEVVGENQVVSIVTRTITATDACGNASTRELVFRILDTQDPQIAFCPTDIGPLVADPNDMLVVNFPTPQFTDNCGFSVSGNIVSGTQLPVGLTTVTYTATDEGGNINVCSFTIEIVKALNIACTTGEISIDNPADFSIADINFPYATTTCDDCPQGNLSNLDYLGYFRGHQYYVSKPGQALTWLEANDYAISLGGRLVQIDNAAENLFVQREMPYAEASIGLYAEDGPGDWVWTFDDNNVGFDNWAPGSPANDPLKPFGIMRSSDGLHVDVDQSQRPYIIEFNCIDFEILGASATGTYDEGLHAIEFVAVDKCGNRDTCEYTFRLTTFDVLYCTPTELDFDSPGEPEYDITSVSIGAFAKTFSAGASYYNLRDTVRLNEDVSTPISLTATSSGSDGSDFPAYWRVWVDANRDGDFYEAGELIFEGFGDASIVNSLTLPSGLGTISPTRLRVGMNRYEWPEPCGAAPFGDYKDFSLRTGAVQAPLIALRGQVVRNRPMLSMDSQEDPSISGYLLLRGETDNDLTKYLDFAAQYADGQQHTYTYSDNDPLIAAYYQAVALDQQGYIVRSSNVVHLTLDSRRGPITTYPNPVRDVLEVDVPGTPEDKDGELELYDALGRRVVRQVWPAGSNHEQMRLPHLPTGTYILRVAHPNRQPLTKRVNVEQSTSTINTGS